MSAFDPAGMGPLIGDLYRPGSPVSGADRDIPSEFRIRQMAFGAMLAGQQNALAVRSQLTTIALRREVMRPRRRWWQRLLWWRS